MLRTSTHCQLFRVNESTSALEEEEETASCSYSTFHTRVILELGHSHQDRNESVQPIGERELETIFSLHNTIIRHSHQFRGRIKDYEYIKFNKSIQFKLKDVLFEQIMLF